MNPALLALNIAVWAAVLVYTLRLAPPLARRWNLWAVLASVAAAAALSFASYRHTARRQVAEAAQRHYIAGIDERQRGNLAEAQRHFERSLALQPGHPQAQRELAEVREQRPVQPREQQRAAEIAVPPAPAGSGAGANAPPQPAPQPARGTPGSKPEPVPHKQSPFEIVHYALDTEIVPAEHRLAATATIRVRSRGGTVPVLDFSLGPEFQPQAVTVDGAAARFRKVNDLLAVTPARALEPGREAVVTVRYGRKGERAAIAGGLGLIGEKGVYFLSESRWYPATGELDFRAPVRVRARVPSGYSVVSVGTLKSRRPEGKSVLYHWETDRLASMVSLAAARYERRETLAAAPVAGGKPVPVTCYTFPEHADRAPAFLKEAASIVRYYERLLGPYPYEKLAVVEIPRFPGGYGTTSFVMLVDHSFRMRRLDREFLAHEIAHQWWGNSVFPQGLGAAWLTEAFSNYCAWMYAASAAGNPRVLTRRLGLAASTFFRESAAEGEQAIRETDPYQPVGAKEAVLYEKGAVVLHTLRHEIGDAAFFRTLRAFADDHRFGRAKIDDFQRVAEQQSGQELDWFFEQWLGRTGGMQLHYRFETVQDASHRHQLLLTVTQEEPAYRAKLDLVLQVGNETSRHTVQLGGPRSELRIPVRGKVLSVLFDPDHDYLMHPPRWQVPD
ncbi:MAG: M1 family aminopeptidase [Armatimonadota bacterium]